MERRGRARVAPVSARRVEFGVYGFECGSCSTQSERRRETGLKPNESWLRPLFLVRTTLSGLNLEPWFIPLFSGTFRASGLNQKRVVQTRNFRSGPLFCGPDQIKWFRPGKTGIFKLLKKPVPPGSDHFSWFKPGKPGPSLFFPGCQGRRVSKVNLYCY